MKNNFLIISIIVILTACMTPQKSFEKKNYKQAFRLALTKVQKGKEADINLPILHQSLDHILHPILLRKDSFQQVGTISFLKKAIDENEKALKYLRKMQAFSTPSHDSLRSQLVFEIPQMNRQIAQQYFDYGHETLDVAIEENNKFLSQKAYNHFANAKKHGRNGAIIDSLQAESLDFGQVIVVVTTNVWSPSLQWDVDREFDNITRCSRRFLQVYYNQNGSNKAVDCRLEFNFPSVGFQTTETEENYDYEQQVIKEYKTVTDTAGHSTQEAVYETVTAHATVTRRTKVASLNVHMNVYSNSPNCNWSSCSTSKSITSQVKIIDTSGDDRALPAEYQHIFGIQDDVEDDDDMAEELVELIYKDIVHHCF